jgi:hypothetical protein
LAVFTTQASKYAFFVPVAIGLGLLSSKIKDLYKRNVFRIYSLVAFLLILILHMALEQNAMTVPMYGVAVFVAALQPWKKFRLDSYIYRQRILTEFIFSIIYYVKYYKYLL